ncbi:MAG: hypothetical protein Q4F00_10835 [bacterium]|nr:hypothetical protein [bacterium]
MAKKNANEVNNINDLAMWISEGQQVGFTFGERNYCIAYGAYADGQGYISLSELGIEPPVGCYIDLDEFLTYARVQGNFLAQIWPLVTEIKLFIPKETAQM